MSMHALFTLHLDHFDSKSCQDLSEAAKKILDSGFAFTLQQLTEDNKKRYSMIHKSQQHTILRERVSKLRLVLC